MFEICVGKTNVVRTRVQSALAIGTLLLGFYSVFYVGAVFGFIGLPGCIFYDFYIDSIAIVKKCFTVASLRRSDMWPFGAIVATISDAIVASTSDVVIETHKEDDMY